MDAAHCRADQTNDKSRIEEKMKICIIGSYGYTGTLICDALSSHAILFSTAGRNKELLQAQQQDFREIVSTYDGDILDKAFACRLATNFDLLINCAGPFTEESAVLLEEAVKNGTHYIDISGEIGFVKSSYEKYDAIAKQTGAIIIHGCAYESLIVDSMVRLKMCTENKPKEIRSFYHFNQKRASPGTKLTMKLSKYRPSLKLQQGHWKESDVIKDQISVTFRDEVMKAIPYPMPEIAYYRSISDTMTVESYLLIDPKESPFLSNDKKPSNEILPTLERLKKIKQKGPTSEERKQQSGSICVQLVSDSEESIYIVETNDMYGTTARAILETVLAMQEGIELSGVLSPASLFENREGELLERLGVSFIEASKFGIINE